MYRTREEMAARRRFKSLEVTTWFKAKRGGKQARDQKDTPTSLKTSLGLKPYPKPGKEPEAKLDKGTCAEEGTAPQTHC